MVSKRQIILIGGSAGSGKNQVGDYLIKRAKSQGFTAKHLYFAKAVKDLAKTAYHEYSVHLNSSIQEAIGKLGEQHEGEGKAVGVLRKLLINPENWYENKTTSTRLLIQSLGTDIVRNTIDREHWVRIVSEDIADSDEDIIVITDFRFPNEYYTLCDILGTADYDVLCVKVDRPVDDDLDFRNHESENSLSDFGSWSYIIDNSKTLKMLETSCNTMFDTIMYAEEEGDVE